MIKFKPAPALTLALALFFSCSQQSEDTEQQAYTPVAENLKGYWVNVDYLAALQETRSTREAGDNSTAWAYKIYDQQSIMHLSIHEGGSEDVLQMDSETAGRIISGFESSRSAAVFTFRPLGYPEYVS